MGKRISRKAMSNLCHQMATMLSAGVGVRRTLDTLRKSTKSSKVSRVLVDMDRSLADGETFADAARANSHVLRPMFPEMAAVGEQTGSLDVVLESLGQYYETQRRLLLKLVTGLGYPAFQLLAAHTVLCLVTFFVVGSNAALKQFVTPFIFVILIYFLGKAAAPFIRGQDFVHSILLALPLVGKLIRKLNVTKFIWAFALAHRAGLKASDSVALAAHVCSNRAFAARMTQAVGHIKEGETLTRAFTATGLFSHSYIEIINVGETSGKLDQNMEKLSKDSLEELVLLFKQISFAAKIIIMLMVMGFIVFLILTMASGYFGRLSQPFG